MPQMIGDPLLPGAPKTKESVVQSPMAPPGVNVTRNSFSLMLRTNRLECLFLTNNSWIELIEFSSRAFIALKLEYGGMNYLGYKLH
jgi:hypothetical protein